MWPFDRRYRIAPAILFASITARHGNPPALVQHAIAILSEAVQTDPTATNLLAMLVSFQAEAGDDDGARASLARFRAAAKVSPLGRRYAISP
jgi:hypothetical protein